MLRLRLLVLLAAASLAATAAAAPAPGYHPIVPSAAAGTVTLTGRDLSIDDIVRVAREGARVAVDPAARAHQQANYGLLLEAAAEGIPVYWFNRGAGDQRETVLFEGDALSAENRPKVEAAQLASFRRGAVFGVGPEVGEEELVRAMMVVRANTMLHNAPSPALAELLLEFLNHRITPVVLSRGTVGEGDLAPLGNVGGAMIGVGEVYYQGVRMPAERALREAGLKTLRPFAADDNALTSSNAYATAQAALLVHDAERALEWADLGYLMALDGMNSSVTPLSLAVQRDRPDPWLNWHAARALAQLKGSYLFESDPARIIQDPESLRASSIRQASAWKAWAELKSAVLFQANSSDHNPAVALDLGPTDAWELGTAQLMKFYVRGGALSGGRHGYIVSNANWDPYPLANVVEAFTIALGNMDVAVALRIERLRNPFFTVVAAEQVLPGATRSDDAYYAPGDLLQEIQGQMVPVAPAGIALVATVEDLEAQTRLKLGRARAALEATWELLAFDVAEGALWLDVRHRQNPAREFGPAPTAAWHSLRQAVPLELGEPDPARPSGHAAAAAFVRATPAARFAPRDAARPDLSAR
ncbi:MAG: aromatic amino acid lyase [Proteobacteria bacterium]|nr:aromatic amino acid lyase [Pseudomonadota bacterium]